MEQQIYGNVDTIDLRELFQTIRKRKKLIYGVTGVITLLAVLYAFMLAKPVYQVQAMIEIGKIEAGKVNEKPLDNIGDIKQKLEYLYGVHSKKVRDFPKVKSIGIGKKSKNIFSVVVEGRDNKSAVGYIDTLVHKIEKDYKQKVDAYIDMKKETIALTKEDMKDDKKNLEAIRKTLGDYNDKLMNITKEDAALAGLYTIQISQNQSTAQELQRHLSALKTRVLDLELAITPLRITQTHIVGKVEVLDKPIKPKKLLIVIVALITGLMFSLFLVFFLSFLQGLKEEK